jgi:Trk-type K+ transport system membrane component
MHYLKRHIPLDLDTFNISRFRRLPLWVVEYKSLQLIVVIVASYMSFFLAAGSLAFYVTIKWRGEDATMNDNLAPSSEQTNSSPMGFSIFMTVSAVTNCGYSLRPLFRSYNRGSHIEPAMLLIIDVLALAGNTCFPVFLRWIITSLSYLARTKSNRKIYFRYLLLNGRSHYTHLFTSQQTWLLFSIQQLSALYR